MEDFENELNESATLADSLDISGIEAQPVPPINDVPGIIRDVKVTGPNKNGNYYVSFGFEFPLDSSDRETVYSGINFNPETMTPGADLSQRTSGYKRWANQMAALVTMLKAACPDENGAPASTFGACKGRIVIASAKAQRDNVTQYEFTRFKKYEEA